MDNLTHSLFALTLARTPLGRAGRGSTAVLLVASNAPDVDVVAMASRALSYLEWHRGPTHGPFGILGLGIASAAVVRLVQRLRGQADEPAAATFSRLAILGMVGALCHVLMDLSTSYGTRMLSPFDWHWFGADWLPIIDVYLLAILIAGLAFGHRAARAAGSTRAGSIGVLGASPAAGDPRRRFAAIALTLMMMNYGLRAVAHHEAIAAAPRLFGPVLPPFCPDGRRSSDVLDRWPRDAAQRAIPAEGRCLVEIAALPTFASPFEWRLIARTSTGYQLRDLNLLREGLWPTRSRAPWRLAVRYSNVWTPPVFEAATSEVGQVFLGFSRFPAVSSFVAPDGMATVRWADVRFLRPASGRAARMRGDSLFTATVRLDSNGRVIDAWLGKRPSGTER